MQLDTNYEFSVFVFLVYFARDVACWAAWTHPLDQMKLQHFYHNDNLLKMHKNLNSNVKSSLNTVSDTLNAVSETMHECESKRSAVGVMLYVPKILG